MKLDYFHFGVLVARSRSGARHWLVGFLVSIVCAAPVCLTEFLQLALYFLEAGHRYLYTHVRQAARCCVESEKICRHFVHTPAEKCFLRF